MAAAGWCHGGDDRQWERKARWKTKIGGRQASHAKGRLALRAAATKLRSSVVASLPFFFFPCSTSGVVRSASLWAFSLIGTPQCPQWAPAETD